jgi:hypothetical protein
MSVYAARSQRRMKLMRQHSAPTRNYDRSIKIQLASLSAELELKDNTESVKRRGGNRIVA